MNHRDTETQRGRHPDERDSLSGRVIGLAIEVHRQIGPGLLESAYLACLCHELRAAGIPYRREVLLPVHYKGLEIECGYRLDIVVEGQLVIELKTVERLQRVHEAQLLTYLRLGGYQRGLLINFNSAVLKDGIKRMVL